MGLRRVPGMSEAEIEERVQESLRLVDLEGYGERYPAELSGGQRKRAGLARAIATRPKYVLYDEPTTGLDPVTTALIDRLILKLREELGRNQPRDHAQHGERVPSGGPDRDAAWGESASTGTPERCQADRRSGGAGVRRGASRAGAGGRVKRQTEVTVGIVVLAGHRPARSSARSGLRGPGSGGSEVTVRARFREVGQLLEGNPVKVRGVPIGRVAGITLEPGAGGVIVEMRISATCACLRTGGHALARVAVRGLAGGDLPAVAVPALRLRRPRWSRTCCRATRCRRSRG